MNFFLGSFFSLCVVLGLWAASLGLWGHVIWAVLLAFGYLAVWRVFDFLERNQ